MKGLDFAVEVVGAGKEEVNGIYFPTSSLKNGVPIYTQSGFFQNPGDDCIFIWRFGSGHWQISKLKGESEIGKDEVHYYTSYIHAESLTPPQVDWLSSREDAGDPPKLSLVQYVKKELTKSQQKSENMLYSKKYSDVHFHCIDGQVVHGHKVIIASSSIYFEKIFDRSWDKTHPDGIWRTSCSSDVIKVMLSYIYTGIVDEKEIAKQPFTFMDLAHECELTTFISILEAFLINYIKTRTIKDIIQCADLYDLSRLKESCIEFIKNHMAEVLMDKEFMKLADENEALWYDIRSRLM